jgi:hypothetical protein
MYRSQKIALSVVVAVVLAGLVGVGHTLQQPGTQQQTITGPASGNDPQIMTDDVGFGAPSTFGGVIPMPSLDRVANKGLR